MEDIKCSVKKDQEHCSKRRQLERLEDEEMRG
jgi:hypothetical protein